MQAGGLRPETHPPPFAVAAEFLTPDASTNSRPTVNEGIRSGCDIQRAERERKCPGSAASTPGPDTERELHVRASVRRSRLHPGLDQRAGGLRSRARGTA